jgi:predicted nucleic acid-binding protein
VAKNYVFDTSAIFAFIKAEAGSGIVENILKNAKKGRCKVYLSFISLMELYYVTWQEKDESTAKELIILIKSLPVQCVDSNERITLSAGRIKANHKVSVADAFVAATAIDKGAILVHKDPEMKVLSKYIETLELPYKRGKS